MILLDFQCRGCDHRWESLEPRPPPAVIECDCGDRADRVISPVAFKQQLASAARQGPPDKPPPGALDTRALAEGQPYAEWNAERKQKRRRERLEQAHRELRT